MTFTAPVPPQPAALPTPLRPPAAALTAPQAALAERIDALLPQTQCTRCGYPDCRGYANAVAAGEAPINRCPPGGAEGIGRLAALTGLAKLPLDPTCGTEAPRTLAVIDEAWCIGCTLCIDACPVDCIVGAPKRMHTVMDADCTGCALCLPACPVDCITLVPASATRTGWQAWTAEQATLARQQYLARQQRQQRLQHDNDERLAKKATATLADLPAHSQHTDPAVLDKKRAVIEAALARARATQAARGGR